MVTVEEQNIMTSRDACKPSPHLKLYIKATVSDGTENEGQAELTLLGEGEGDGEGKKCLDFTERSL